MIRFVLIVYSRVRVVVTVVIIVAGVVVLAVVEDSIIKPAYRGWRRCARSLAGRRRWAGWE